MTVIWQDKLRQPTMETAETAYHTIFYWKNTKY